jgi:hypothetical protein
MAVSENDERWRVKMVQPRLPWITRPLLPADLGQELCSVMLNRENALEDASYQKVVPNRYIVEVNPDNYERNYRPVEGRVIQQWQIRLGECLATANSRLGRREYVLAGKFAIQVRPAEDLQKHQARVLCQIWQGNSRRGSEPRAPRPGDSEPRLSQHSAPAAPPWQSVPAAGPQARAPEFPAAQPTGACLEELQGGRRWLLYPGVMTLGRLDNCDIAVGYPLVQERRLVSGKHAFIHTEGRRIRLFDGSPDGRPSLNGTYVNSSRIFATGYDLQDGDIVTLAAVDPNHPQPEDPGVVSFRFRINC